MHSLCCSPCVLCGWMYAQFMLFPMCTVWMDVHTVLCCSPCVLCGWIYAQFMLFPVCTVCMDIRTVYAVPRVYCVDGCTHSLCCSPCVLCAWIYAQFMLFPVCTVCMDVHTVLCCSPCVLCAWIYAQFMLFPVCTVWMDVRTVYAVPRVYCVHGYTHSLCCSPCVLCAWMYTQFYAVPRVYCVHGYTRSFMLSAGFHWNAMHLKGKICSQIYERANDHFPPKHLTRIDVIGSELGSETTYAIIVTKHNHGSTARVSVLCDLHKRKLSIRSTLKTSHRNL